jgi:SM-20-related protein
LAYLDIAALRAAPLETQPYEHLIVEGFVPQVHAEALIGSYPAIEQAGSFPLDTLTYGGAFAALIEEMNAEPFRKAVEEKFDVDLEGKATMFTARGRCRAEDGKIHTDSKSKIITVLLYMNEDWAPQGGRLRLLRDGENLENWAREVPPGFGTLLLFRRSERSWHGHLPFEGPRRVIQMNWVTSQRVAAWEQFRHRVSAATKRLKAAQRA